MKRLALGLALAAALPTAVQAQALRCTIPGAVTAPHADLPTAEQPARRLPIGSYTLALSWSPQYCRASRRDPADRFQCGSANRFGFTLHGLWPDGTGATWPQYCGAARILEPRTLARNLCATPSAQLLQHEWAKHGTCMPGETPDGYFAKGRRLYDRLRYPDMAALSRRPLTAGGLAQAITRANPGLAPNMLRITARRGGWLDEVWLCLDTALRYRACPAHQGGLAPTAPLRIWRGRR